MPRSPTTSNDARHDAPAAIAYGWAVNVSVASTAAWAVVGRAGGEERGDEQRRRAEADEAAHEPGCSGRGDVELHHDEAVGEPVEAGRLVEGQGAVVVDGRVHEAVAEPAGAHPAQRVEHEGSSVALALVAGRDREALQVPMTGRGAGDGEAAQGPPAIGAGHEPGARPVQRRRPADLGEVVGVVAPRVAERLAVDARRLRVTARPEA